MPTNSNLTESNFVNSYSIENEHAISIDQVASPEITSFKTEMAAGAILLAKKVEAVAWSASLLTAIYVTMRVYQSLRSHVIIWHVLLKPNPLNLIDSLQSSIKLSMLGTATGIGSLGMGHLTFSLGVEAVKAIRSGRIKIEEMAGPEAKKRADTIIAKLPSIVKRAAIASMVTANFVGLAAIIDSVFKTNLFTPTAIVGGIAATSLVGIVSVMRAQP